jgi:hypothetical protein
MSEFAPYRMYVECHVECRAYFTVGINKPVSNTGKNNECREFLRKKYALWNQAFVGIWMPCVFSIVICHMAFKFQQRLDFKGYTFLGTPCISITNIYIHSECLYCTYVCVGEVLKLSRYTNLWVCHSCFFFNRFFAVI